MRRTYREGESPVLLCGRARGRGSLTLNFLEGQTNVYGIPGYVNVNEVY